MTEYDPGPAPADTDETKHSKTLRTRDGRAVCLTRGDELHALTVHAGDGAGAASVTVWLTESDLRSLVAVPGAPSCANCGFSRFDASGRELRCHRSTPRKRGDEVFFPRMQRGDWCGKYKAMRAVA